MGVIVSVGVGVNEAVGVNVERGVFVQGGVPMTSNLVMIVRVETEVIGILLMFMKPTIGLKVVRTVTITRSPNARSETIGQEAKIVVCPLLSGP